MALAALPAAVLLGPAAAAAAPPSYGPAIDLATAKKVAAAAEAVAQKVSSQPDVIAIVDPHGALIYFERMDGAQFGSIDVALSKARSAALFRRPTKAFAERLAKGATALLGLVGATPVRAASRSSPTTARSSARPAPAAAPERRTTRSP